MLKIYTGLHYGKNVINGLNSHKRYFYISLRPFHWEVDPIILQKQHAKHYFKNDWLKVGNIATVEDSPQNNAVYLIAKYEDTSAEHIANDLHDKGFQVKPILRPKAIDSNKYKDLCHLIEHMLHFGKKFSNQRKASDNVIVQCNKDKHHRYMFASL